LRQLSRRVRLISHAPILGPQPSGHRSAAPLTPGDSRNLLSGCAPQRPFLVPLVFNRCRGGIRKFHPRIDGGAS